MRIACIGNMNNNMFCLVRYLRQRGLEADLLLLSHEMEHFLPGSDSYADYGACVRQLSWGSEADFSKTAGAAVASDLAGYGAILACNYAPAFLDKAGIAMDIFLPHGSDYYEVPFYRDRTTGEPTLLAEAQLRSIRNAGHIFIPRMNEGQDRVWERIAPRSRIVHLPVPILYMPEYSEVNIRAHYVPDYCHSLLRGLRERHDLLIFHHVRHCWLPSSPATEHKGNDILLKGLARYVAKTGANPALVTVEYGSDVEASKNLVEELGIGRQVYWLPRMDRKRIMPLLSLCDLVAVEFAYSWIAGGVLYEALCMRKPVLCRRDDEFYAGMELFPVLRATTDEEVAARLIEFAAAPGRFAEDGLVGSTWLETKVITPAVDEIERTIVSRMAVSA